MYTNYPNYQNYLGYQNYPSQLGYMGNQGYNMSYGKDKDDRFFPFLAPFLLGGLAGAAVAPAFYRPYPYYYPPFYGPRPFYW